MMIGPTKQIMGEMNMKDISFSHVGLCVSDLDTALRFYCDGLGFEQGLRYDVGNECRDSLEVEGDVRLTSAFISRGNTNIELLAYSSPGVQGEPSKSRSQLGLTHLSLYVESLEEAGARLVEFGGTCLSDTKTELPQANGGVLKLCFLPTLTVPA